MPDRRRLEAAMTEADRATLERHRADCDVADWTEEPGFASFVASTVFRTAGARVRELGESPTRALHAACRHFDVEVERVRAWARRWPARSRRSVQSAQRSRRVDAVELVRDAATHSGTEEAA